VDVCGVGNHGVDPLTLVGRVGDLLGLPDSLVGRVVDAGCLPLCEQTINQ
jgi:hypothetical protein